MTAVNLATIILACIAAGAVRYRHRLGNRRSTYKGVLSNVCGPELLHILGAVRSCHSRCSRISNTTLKLEILCPMLTNSRSCMFRLCHYSDMSDHICLHMHHLSCMCLCLSSQSQQHMRMCHLYQACNVEKHNSCNVQLCCTQYIPRLCLLVALLQERVLSALIRPDHGVGQLPPGDLKTASAIDTSSTMLFVVPFCPDHHCMEEGIPRGHL